MPTFDQNKAEAFSDTLLDILNHSALALMISVGHRTGLFDTMAQLPAATSHEIAEQAKLNERYVREWLGAMVTGKIIDYHSNTQQYQLSPEHASSLTRKAAPNNIAVTTQWVSVLGNVEDKIVACFQKGGGVAYEDYPRFHEVMAEESDQSVVAVLEDLILPLVPGLVEQLKQGITVLDVGCGSGRALNLMAQSFPKSRFTGYDFSEESISMAQQTAQKQNLKNVSFAVQDVSQLPEKEHYDLITAFDAIHDQQKPDQVLKSIQQALRPQGIFLMQDIAGSSLLEQDMTHPVGPFLYTVSCMHCMSVSLAQAGMGLGTMWGEKKARTMLQEAGFKKVIVKQLPHDPMNYYYLIYKS